MTLKNFENFITISYNFFYQIQAKEKATKLNT